jgi:hypothetical protein
MFDPTLFGVASSQYLHFASLMLAPTLGFVFLFLLGLPLKKIPGIDLGDYSPPKWLVPIFALSSLFVISCSTSISFFLNFLSESPVHGYFRSLLSQGANVGCAIKLGQN